jgi:hypothetical protein
MRASQFRWRTALLLCGAALGGALFPLADAHEGDKEQLKELKYPRGSNVTQVYAAAPDKKGFKLAIANWGGVATATVATFAADEPKVRDAGLELRPRTVTRIRPVRRLAGEAPPKVAVAADPEKLAVFEFDLLYDKIPVAKASRTVGVRGGAPLFIKDRNFPKNPPKLGAANERLKFEAVREAGLKNAREMFAKIYPKAEPILAVDTSQQAVPRLEIWPDPQGNAKLAWSYSVRSTDRRHPFLRHYWVSADLKTGGEILEYEDLIFYAQRRRACAVEASPRGNVLISSFPLDIPREPIRSIPKRGLAAGADGKDATVASGVAGAITGTVWESSPFGNIVSRPLPGLDVHIIKEGEAPKLVQTNKQGKYSLAGMKGPVTVRVTLRGPACRIFNAQGPGAQVLTQTAKGEGTIDLSFAVKDEFELAQINAFCWVTEAFDFVRDHLPETPTKLAGMGTHVNIDDTCNAFYDPNDNTVNFFRSAAGACPNTAYRDVVLHEYGHALDDEFGGIMDGAYSEGFGDALSILVTRSPIIGLDFHGPPNGTTHKNLRDATKVFNWPDVMNSEAHTAGQAYNGFTWELTRQLVTKYQGAMNPDDQAFEVAKQLVLGAGALNPLDIPEAVRLSFYVDAVLYPGPTGSQSTHFNELKAAAQSRKLPIPTDPLNLASASQ